MIAHEFLELLRRITDAEPRVRESGADEVTDRLSSYLPAQAAALATVLSATAVGEADHAALEAELHAILELTSTGHVEVSHISYLRDISTSDWPVSLREYVTDLLEE